jgi:cell division protein FtsB
MLKQLKPYITLNNGVLLVALLITISWVWGTVEAIQRNFVLQQQVDTLTQELAFYDLENETLLFQQKYYQTDEFIELSARARLNKAMADEKLLMLPPTMVSTEEVSEAPSTVTPITERSNFQQWLYFLFAAKQ